MLLQNVSTAVLGGMLFLGGVTIDEKSLIPIGSAAAVMAGVWWIGRKLQHLEDRQGELFRMIKDLRCSHDKCNITKNR